METWANIFLEYTGNIYLWSNVCCLSLVGDQSKPCWKTCRAVFLLAASMSLGTEALTWYSHIMTERVTNAFNAPAFFWCLFCLFASVPCLAGHRPTVGTWTRRSNCILLCWDGAGANEEEFLSFSTAPLWCTSFL